MTLHFRITEGNRSGPKAIRHAMAITVDAPAGSFDSTWHTKDDPVSSHADAVERIRTRLLNERNRLAERVAQLDYNLDNIEIIYAMPQLVADQVSAQYSELVEGFRNLQEKQGAFRIGPLLVTNNYLANADKHLFVMSLPEYDAVTQRFSVALCDCIQKAMAEAGLVVIDQWNGAQALSYSYSVKVAPARTNEPDARSA
jgi:hypothetical protein